VGKPGDGAEVHEVGQLSGQHEVLQGDIGVGGSLCLPILSYAGAATEKEGAVPGDGPFCLGAVRKEYLTASCGALSC
jgi:hypothetical protein